MGDLNLMPHEIGFKILRDNAFLLDSYTEAMVLKKLYNNKHYLNCIVYF
jgi:hypothetical protein